MSPKQRFNFFIDDAQRDELRRIKDADGIPESEQIRRAIEEWLARRGSVVKADRKRVSPRKRP